jgi:TetR/AcrR family transcriptional regulator, transcriptional repressor for nem operon
LETTKEHILDTAFKLFSSKGFKEITMQDLVRASGLSKGAFYHYFKSKKEIYELALEKYLFGFIGEMKFENATEYSLRETIKQLFGKVAYLAENIQQSKGGGGLSAYMLLLQSALQQPKLREKFKEFGQTYYTEFNRSMKNAIESGEIRNDLDAEVLTHHIFSIMEGLVLIYSFGIEMPSLSGTFNRIIDQLFDLLETKK